MKRIKYLLLYVLFFTFLMASMWTSDVKTALEMENNITNTGNGTAAYTNYASIPYSNSIFYAGLYSAGPINTTGQHIRSNAAESTAYKTIQFSTYVVASGLPTDAEYVSDSNFNVRFYVYSGVMYYCDASKGQIGGYTIGTGAFHTWIANYDGTHVDIYKDGIHLGQMVASQPGYGSVNYNIGNYEGYNLLSYCNCYMDNIIMSTNNSAGVEITPAVPSATLTYTLTPTLTWTLTPTLTYTLTPTLTSTLTSHHKNILHHPSTL